MSERTNASPLVSVIMLAYQHPAFLNAALASVAAQTYSAIEIIVVDDASGPETVAQYQLPHNARLLVNEKNAAVAAINRNIAIRAARGSYLAFLDQDDLWHQEKIALQVAALGHNPVAVFHYTQTQSVDENLAPLSRQERFFAPGSDPLALLIRRNVVPYSSVLARRTAIDDAGLFDESIRGAADWDMWLRLTAMGPVFADARPLTLRRRHASQWSNAAVMMAQGAESVLAKAARWIPEKRPELRSLVNRRHARWLRELARAQLNDGTRNDALEILHRAAKIWPWDMKTYSLIWRARRAAAARSIP